MVAVTNSEEPRVAAYIIRLCDPCIAGEGDMCHTPACALIRHAVDIPIMRELLAEVPDVLKAEAGPDLCAALEALVKKIEEYGDPNLYREELTLADAAFAKARGDA